MRNHDITTNDIVNHLLKVLHQKEITILAHDNIDIDAALSGILLSRLLNFLNIKNTFKILEPVQHNETYTVVKELIGIDLKDFESISEGENESATLFLVDHNETIHSGNVIGFIDHHPSEKYFLGIPFVHTLICSATTSLIYDFMKAVNFPITKQDALMIVTAMMTDSVCFKNTKSSPYEIELAKQLCTDFNLDWNYIETFALCLTPIDKMSLDEIITNGSKQYNFNGSKVASAYVQLSTLPDTSTIDAWLQELAFSLFARNLKMYVFLLFDLANNKTYEYRITENCIREIVHDKIVSRGKDIMPKIEKMFLKPQYSLEFKIAEIIRILASSKKTIATMESCTGGQLASDITSVSNASEILRESYITYCNEAKIKLGVPAEIIKKHSVYSYETAIAMSNAVANFANANIGIGITGQLGRIDPCNPGVSDNEVWYSIYLKDSNSYFTSKLFILYDVSREQKKKIVTEQIIKTLYEIII